MNSKVSIPYIIFEVTQECNLTCLYCYNYWRRENEVVRKTSYKQADSTLNKLLKTVDFQHITFTGGEPFLADGLMELILKCKMNRKSVNVISNGTIATYHDYKVLKDLQVSLVELPLHAASSSIHDSMTGCDGSFNKVIQSIKSVKEMELGLCIVVVLTKINIDLLDETLEFAVSLGVKNIMLARFNIGGRGIVNSDKLLPSLHQIERAFKIANSFVQVNNVTISANVCLPECIVSKDDYPGIYISRCTTEISKRPITVSAYGDVRVCNHSPNILGNVNTTSVEKMFESEYVKVWETSCPEYCRTCTKWKTCKGGCRAASEQLNQTLYSVDPIVKELNPCSIK